jgi:hypothetical protein
VEIPILLDVMAACYFRLSDECLYEVQMVQKIAKGLPNTSY